MSRYLFRVDERLIHGQVVVGWGRRLGLQRIVVVSDEIASDPVTQELYRSGVPDDTETRFCGIEEALTFLREHPNTRSTIVLTENLATMAVLVERGADIDEVNVGGIYSAPGRVLVLPYVWLDDEDRARVHAIEAAGVPVIAQDVPNGTRVSLGERLS